MYFLCKHVRGFQQHRPQNCPAPGVLAALFVVLPRTTHPLGARPFDTGSTRQQQGHSCDSYPDWWFWLIALITVVQHVVRLSFWVGRRERQKERKWWLAVTKLSSACSPKATWAQDTRTEFHQIQICPERRLLPSGMPCPKKWPTARICFLAETFTAV